MSGTEWNGVPLVDFACSVRSTHNVIIYLTAYPSPPYPILKPLPRLKLKQIKANTLLAANSKLYDVSAIIMPDLMCRLDSEMELVYQREF